jgi:hypothetical protein
MSAVRNVKRRTSDICDGAPKGRGRYSNTSRSRFVLRLAAGAYLASWAFVGVGLIRIDLTTGFCHERSVLRASVTAAMLMDPADALSSICCSAFKQA